MIIFLININIDTPPPRFRPQTHTPDQQPNQNRQSSDIYVQIRDNHSGPKPVGRRCSCWGLNHKPPKFPSADLTINRQAVACAGRSSWPVGGIRSCASVTHLCLVPECQDIDCIGSRFVSVKGNIAGIPEGNHQFAQRRHFRERSTKVGGRFQQQELPLDGLTCSLGGIR